MLLLFRIGRSISLLLEFKLKLKLELEADIEPGRDLSEC